ncbi:hypothetical protein [Rubricoccus marinus]|uniref:DUF3106 domain-containing protein n=1 Tax=Rubricoccus marinus TaxID=716817 RepID=A0A259U0U2_9BACT|nr:hypothetical protein [Rubricoccus marinus]OZC03601.1 hypothetical protein BSZ36_11770 [Rubricoccus marinus]
MTRFLRFAALAALFVLPLSASAQRAAGERSDRAERSPEDRAERHLERLTERLSLTDSQVAMVKASMSGERTAGSSWDLAARLAPTLSAAQMEALKAPRQRGERGVRGERAQNGEASGERAERRQERETRRAESQAARDAALGLSAAQKQALESARSERQALPSGMADVLTDDQEAVLLVHRAISGPRGARGGKGGRGMRRGGRR